MMFASYPTIILFRGNDLQLCKLSCFLFLFDCASLSLIEMFLPCGSCGLKTNSAIQARKFFFGAREVQHRSERAVRSKVLRHGMG